MIIALIGFTNTKEIRLIQELNRTWFKDYIYFKVINRPDDARGILFDKFIVCGRQFEKGEWEGVMKAVEIVKHNLRDETTKV